VGGGVATAGGPPDGMGVGEGTGGILTGTGVAPAGIGGGGGCTAGVRAAGGACAESGRTARRERATTANARRANAEADSMSRAGMLLP